MDLGHRLLVERLLIPAPRGKSSRFAKFRVVSAFGFRQLIEGIRNRDADLGDRGGGAIAVEQAFQRNLRWRQQPAALIDNQRPHDDAVVAEAMAVADCNNVLLAAAAGSVFIGTMDPLLLDAIGGGKISVGPPYVEAVFAPLMAPALFLMGVGPAARWKRSSLPDLAVLLRWALAASLAVGLLLPFAMGEWHALVGFSLALALWIVVTSLMTLRRSLRQTRAHYGMVLAHVGVAVFVAGVADERPAAQVAAVGGVLTEQTQPRGQAPQHFIDRESR